MNKKTFIFLALLAAGAVAPFVSNAGLEVPAAISDSDLKPLPIDGIYRFVEETEVTPSSYTVEGQMHSTDGDQQGFIFKKGEPVGVEFLGNGIVRLNVALIDGEAEDLPSSLVVSQDQLPEGLLQRVGDGNGRDLMAMYGEYIGKGGEAASRRGGGRIGHGHGWGNGGCVSYIKRVTGIYGHLGNGVAAASSLLRHGYRSTSCSNPTPGTIASWAGHGAGHVAQWDGSCWRTNVAAACSIKHGDPGSGYRMVNCVIR